MPVTTEEKADPSHFALLKVLGQERLHIRTGTSSVGRVGVDVRTVSVTEKGIIWKSFSGEKNTWKRYR